jgi:hypothetical protein
MGTQELIDVCTNARVVIGAQSAPPKLALLQGTRTYMVGHEKERHTVTENWMGSEVGFYEVGKGKYHELDIEDCVNKTMEFIRC